MSVRVPTRTRFGIAATLVALLILVFAGSATATRLVTGKQIKDDTVRSIDLRDGTVGGEEIRDDSLKPSSVDPFVKVNDMTGPAGPAGGTGGVGAVGPHGVSGMAYVPAPPQLVYADTTRVVNVSCPGGTVVVSGGVAWTPGTEGLELTQSAPHDYGRGWQTQIRNESGTTQSVTGWVVCLPDVAGVVS